jgi:glycosyltransferase involved in cell wall biosynthesis
VSPRKIKVVPNYVDTDIFRPMINVTPIEGRVCYVGRLHKIKNLESLIKASTDIPKISLVFIGQGDQRTHLERIARDYQVSVKFLGALPHNKIPFELNRSSAFILPSLSEGNPKALIEAMSCGLPVIGTDIPGIQDVIQHGETGLLCSPEPDSIRETIQEIIDNLEFATRLGQNARHYAINNFSIERIVEIELNAIQEVTNS